jgi:hypothetical protein
VASRRCLKPLVCGIGRPAMVRSRSRSATRAQADGRRSQAALGFRSKRNGTERFAGRHQPPSASWNLLRSAPQAVCYIAVAAWPVVRCDQVPPCCCNKATVQPSRPGTPLLSSGTQSELAKLEWSKSGWAKRGWESRWLRHRVRKTRPRGSGSKPHQPTIIEWLEASFVQWQDTRPISAGTWFDSGTKQQFGPVASRAGQRLFNPQNRMGSTPSRSSMSPPKCRAETRRRPADGATAGFRSP